MGEFPFIEVNTELRKVLGKLTPETRLYHRIGDQHDLEEWFDALHKHVGACVSPGGAAARAHVSRAAVHKRLRNGGLTAFMFHATKENHMLPWILRVLSSDTRGLCYIPVSECLAWAAELQQRPEREEAVREALGEEKDGHDDRFAEVPKDMMKQYREAKREARKQERKRKKV